MCGDRVINRTRILAETDRVIDAPEEHVANTHWTELLLTVIFRVI
jgi:hypothetical protein